MTETALRFNNFSTGTAQLRGHLLGAVLPALVD